MPATIQWLGNVSFDWSNAANWAGGQVPGASDVALFDSSGVLPVIVDVPQTVLGVNFSSTWGKSLSLTASLTTIGASTWSSGSLNGTGTGAAWNNLGTITIGGGSPYFSGPAILNNSGVIDYFTTGTLAGSGNLNNLKGGVFDFHSDAKVVQSGNSFVFSNAGLIRKSAGTGITSIQISLDNAGGTIEAQTGTMMLQGFGSTYAGGVFNALLGATVDVTGGQGVQWSGTFTGSGSGRVVHSAGNIVVGAAGATFNFPSGLFEWNGGFITAGVSSYVLSNTGTITLNGATPTLYGVVFSNFGTIRHNSASDLQVYDSGSQLINEVTGIYDFQSNAGITTTYGTVLVNKGLLRKSAGVGTSIISPYITLNNLDGYLDVMTGAIDVPGTFVTGNGGVTGKGTVLAPVNNNSGFVRPGPVSGTLIFNGDYNQGPTAIFAPEMKGTSVSDWSQLSVNGTVTVNGLLAPVVNYLGKLGDTFTVLLNDGTDSINGSFANAPDGGTFVSNGTTFGVSYNGGDGNDLVLTVQGVAAPATAPPRVALAAPNGGGAQRSRVLGLLVRYDQPIAQTSTVAAAYQLKRQSDNGTVVLSGFNPRYWDQIFTKFGIAPVVSDYVFLTFSPGAVVDYNSLADGRYTLTIDADQISSANGKLDGDGNGAGGDSYVLAGNPGNGLFRLFGDANGDGTVAANDFIQFRLALGGGSLMFDFDNDGAVAASDFIQFRLRFGGSI